MASPRRAPVRAQQDSSPGSVRRPPERSRDLALVAVFAALVAALALAPAFQVGALPVPLTLQTLGVMLCGAVLGPWRGALAALVYLVVGFAGLPVFAGGAGGLGVLASPTAGFLLSYPLAALVGGALARAGVRRGRGPRLPALLTGCLLGGVVVVYAAGIAGLRLNGGFDLRTATVGMLPFLPGDLVKAVLAVAVAAPVHRAFPRLLGR